MKRYRILESFCFCLMALMVFFKTVQYVGFSVLYNGMCSPYRVLEVNRDSGQGEVSAAIAEPLQDRDEPSLAYEKTIQMHGTLETQMWLDIVFLGTLFVWVYARKRKEQV